MSGEGGSRGALAPSGASLPFTAPGRESLFAKGSLHKDRSVFGDVIGISLLSRLS